MQCKIKEVQLAVQCSTMWYLNAAWEVGGLHQEVLVEAGQCPVLVCVPHGRVQLHFMCEDGPFRARGAELGLHSSMYVQYVGECKLECVT